MDALVCRIRPAGQMFDTSAVNKRMQDITCFFTVSRGGIHAAIAITCVPPLGRYYDLMAMANSQCKPSDLLFNSYVTWLILHKYCQPSSLSLTTLRCSVHAQYL